MRRALVMIVSAAALLTVVPIAAGVASAHGNTVSGVAVCQSNGTFTVTWTLRNDSGPTETFTLGSYTPNGGSVSVTGFPTADVAAGAAARATQAGIPGSATVATLTAVSHWSDSFPDTSQTGTVALAGNCVSPRPHVVPVAPVFHEGTCTDLPSVDAPSTAAYDVTITGTVGFGSTVTVTFTAKGNVVLDGQTVYSHTFLPRPGNCTTTTTSTTTAPPDDSTTTTTIDKTLTFQVLGPICVADHPYIHWELTSTGLRPDQNLATITITDINGNVVQTLTDQPLAGSTLWPGASLDPEDWPGWVKIGGIWYIDPTDAVLRQGVYVRADINPTAGPLLVAYPEATAACAQPEVAGGTTTRTVGVLPVTGTSRTGTLWIAVGFLGVGGLALAVARRRRHV